MRRDARGRFVKAPLLPPGPPDLTGGWVALSIAMACFAICILGT